ncbi:MAG: LysR family transcriptional regulator [Oscillospiraceae bacterium]|nr:LysR family transcriptional regulator [Oscillospiraceae bacterium]
MTVRHMRIFIEVYQSQNVTKAAELLHMTQPAVTRAIQEIENYYGVRLFERINRRLSVTETGKMLYQQALHIVGSFDDLEKGLYNWDHFGILRVGASITIGNHFLPEFVVRFKEQYPHAHVEMMVLNGEALQTALMENALDIALIEGAVDDPDLRFKVFSRDKLLLITPPSHVLMQQDSVYLSDLLHYDLLMREKGSAGRTFLENVFSAKGLSLRPSTISISTQAIIKAVHCGLGISLLPQKLVEEDIKRGNVCARDIADANLERENNIVWHRNKYLSPMIKSFIEICEQAEST